MKTIRKPKPTPAEHRFLARLDGRPETADELRHAVWALSGRLQPPLEGLEGEEQEQIRRVLLALGSALDTQGDSAAKLETLDGAARKVFVLEEPKSYEQLAGLDVAHLKDAGDQLVNAVRELRELEVRKDAFMAVPVTAKHPDDGAVRMALRRRIRSKVEASFGDLLVPRIAHLPWCRQRSPSDLAESLSAVRPSPDDEDQVIAIAVLRALGVSVKDARNHIKTAKARSQHRRPKKKVSG